MSKLPYQTSGQNLSQCFNHIIILLMRILDILIKYSINKSRGLGYEINLDTHPISIFLRLPLAQVSSPPHRHNFLVWHRGLWRRSWKCQLASQGRVLTSCVSFSEHAVARGNQRQADFSGKTRSWEREDCVGDRVKWGREICCLLLFCILLRWI